MKLIGDSVQDVEEKRLLILRLDSIGDYVLFRNFLEIIRSSEKYRDYHITLCGNEVWRSIAESYDHLYVDAFIWTDAPGLQIFKNRFRLARTIRKRKFRVVIHPTFSRCLNNDLLVICSGAQERICYSGDAVNMDPIQLERNNKRFTRLIQANNKFKFEFYRNRDFIDQLLSTKCSLTKPELNQETLDTDLLIICPGASAASRRWSALNFARFIESYTAVFPDVQVAICGGKLDKTLALQIIEESDREIQDFTGQLTLTQLTYVFAKAKLIVTNDSGPFHLAVALNKRVICISSGNNYGRFVPYPPEMFTKSKTIFPPDLYLLKNEISRLNEFGCAHEKIDINKIAPEFVLDSLKDLIFNES